MRRLIYLFFVSMAMYNAIYAQETIVIQDGLQGSTVGTRVGGSFSSEGYKPGIGFNHILYDVPRQVREGYVEFQVKGFSKSLMQDPNGGADADNGFIGMYDGRGSSEPIKYFNNFKYNFFRWNFHYRQGRSAVKAVIDCADPNTQNLTATQAWHDCAQDGGCSDPREWYSEPTGSSYSFNASTWYTIRLTWRSKTFKVTINGTQVWAATPSPGPNDYNPIDFKIWLGGAPGYDDKYGNWVPGTTYRNFKLVSYTGGGSTQTAPQITSSAVTSAVVKQLYSYDVNASGNPTPTYSLTTFPSGMTINSTSGLIQWTPGATGNYNVSVRASNGVTPNATQSFTISVQTGSSSGNCPSSLISYWKLDETSGSTYNNSAGSNDATSSNTPTPVTGRVSGGQQFDGAGDRITASRIAAYDFSAGSGFTFEAWIKHANVSYTKEEVIIERKPSSGSLVINLKFNSNKVTFLARNTSGQLFSVTGVKNLWDGNWHHVVGVKDGSLNQLRLYVDGVLEKTASASYSAGFASSNAGISIGWRNISGDPSYFKGSIDEVAIYNSALDAASILLHHNNGLQNKGYCTTVSGNITAAPEDVSITQQVESENNQPAEYKLYQNYPNPFNPSTKIRFGVASPADVSIKIFNELGEIISEPVNSFYNPGYYEISVNMDNFAAGVYFYRISSGNFIAVKKMLLIK